MDEELRLGKFYSWLDFEADSKQPDEKSFINYTGRPKPRHERSRAHYPQFIIAQHNSESDTISHGVDMLNRYYRMSAIRNIGMNGLLPLAISLWKANSNPK